MKKHLFILGFAMLLSVASAFAQGGTTGPLTWELTGTGNNLTLTISGEGEMPDYYKDMPGQRAPWYDYRGSITTVIIENGVTRIGDDAFFSYPAGAYSIISISIPNSVTSIGDYAFYQCIYITSITIPDGVRSIGGYAFAYCHFTSITFPSSVTTIGVEAFFGCRLESITLPSSVTTIGAGAFSGCRFESITLPSSITTIGDKAFANCTALTLVTNLNPKPIAISSMVFSGVNISVCELRVPADEVPRYQNADVWKSFYIVGCYLVKVAANDDEYGFVSGDDFYKANATATVTATAYSGYKFVNWTKDGVEISTKNPYSFTVTEDIELVANFEETVGIDDVETWHAASLRIYPNPTTGLLTISDNRISDIGQSEIVIYDVMGRVVHVETHGRASLQSQIAPPPAPSKGGEFSASQIEIDISHLPQGVYGVSVISEGRVVGNGKVVKM